MKRLSRKFKILAVVTALAMLITVVGPVGCSGSFSNRGHIKGLEGATFNARFFHRVATIPYNIPFFPPQPYNNEEWLMSIINIEIINNLNELYAWQNKVLDNIPYMYYFDGERSFWTNYFTDNLSIYNESFFEHYQLILINNLQSGGGVLYYVETIKYYANTLTINLRHGRTRIRGCNVAFLDYFAFASGIVEITHISQNLIIEITNTWGI